MIPSVASEKIPGDTTGDQSRDLPTSSAVPKPPRYLRPPYVIGEYKKPASLCQSTPFGNDHRVLSKVQKF
jgi:hypothetical protein